MIPATQGLESWLNYIESVHPSEMELGLARVAEVARRLSLEQPTLTIVTVGGTNGKGSTVRMLEAIWSAAGHRVGAATSPHVSRFNERFRIDAAEVDDASIVAALNAVDAVRGEIALTYFEFATLASMQAFVAARCDVAVMEVGLGGRLDAVNLWDTDCAVLTSIALDHADWLGSDRAVIATEKAAIGRRGRPFVLGEPDPPDSLATFVASEGLELIDIGSQRLDDLPTTSLPGAHQRRNAGCALAVVKALSARLPVDAAVAVQALHEVALVARFEERTVNGQALVLDVAHNPAAALALADAWRERFGSRRGIAVFASLADKDIEGIAGALAPVVAEWICTPIDAARAGSVETLARRVRAGLREQGMREHETAAVRVSANVGTALDGALDAASERRLPVLVCGSFVTVTAAHRWLAG